MFHRILPYIVVSGSVLASGILFAQPPGRGGPPNGQPGGPPPEMILELFQQADANNDGCVTKSELTAAMQGQGRGNQRGTRPPARPQQNNPGNIPGGNPNADGPQHGPPPQPGQILPEPVIESLSLTENQTKQLAVLQATVYKRLARILTDEQQEQLANTRPPERPE